MASSSNKASQPGTVGSRIAIKRHLETLKLDVASAQRLAAELYPGAETEQCLSKAHAHIEQALREVRAAPLPTSPPPTARPTASSSATSRVKEKKSPPVQVACPHCQSLMPQKLLASHIQQKHHGKRPVSKPKKVTRTSERGSTRGTRSVDPSRDPYDGGRSLSESRREDGRFGSLPLYDSYDEESRP